MLCSIARRWSPGDGRGDKGWDGDGLGVKRWMNLKQTGLVMGCFGGKAGLGPDWLGMGLDARFVRAVLLHGRRGLEGKTSAKGSGRWLAEGLGLWGKAGSEEEEEEPKEGRSGG